MPQPTRINKSLGVKTPSGAIMMSSPAAPKPGVVKTVAKAVGKDIKGSAMLPLKTAVGVVKNAPAAAKNLATQPKAAIKSGFKSVAQTHTGIAKAVMSPVQSAKRGVGPLKLGVAATMAATGGGIGSSFVHGAANTRPKT